LIAAVLMSLLAAFVARNKLQQSFLPAAISQMGATCAFLFMVLGVYVQLTGKTMSFVDLLPSSLLVALVSVVPFVIFNWSKGDGGPGTLVIGITWLSAVSGLSLAFMVSFFPKLVALQTSLVRWVWSVL
jgi:hypothetical protein